MYFYKRMKEIFTVIHYLHGLRAYNLLGAAVHPESLRVGDPTKLPTNLSNDSDFYISTPESSKQCQTRAETHLTFNGC